MQKIVLRLLKPSRKYVEDSDSEEETNDVKKPCICVCFSILNGLLTFFSYYILRCRQKTKYMSYFLL